MNCYACDAAAINACKRCAKPYCEDHGNAQYCADCLKPSSALPSFNLYRGSLLVMLLGTAIAVVLIIRPPGETKGASPVVVGGASPTATASGGTPQPTVAAQTPGAAASAAAGSATPAASGTATVVPSPTATPAPFNEYTVKPGDSVAGIAQQLVSPGDDLIAFENAIINLNNLDANNPVLHPGQVLLIPKKH